MISLYGSHDPYKDTKLSINSVPLSSTIDCSFKILLNKEICKDNGGDTSEQNDGVDQQN